MPLVKVKDNYQVTIPVSLLKKFNIAPGDTLEAKNAEEGILFKKCITDKDLMKDLNNTEKGTLQAVLQHAGKWSDMSDDEAEHLIKDIRKSRRSSHRESEF